MIRTCPIEDGNVAGNSRSRDLGPQRGAHQPLLCDAQRARGHRHAHNLFTAGLWLAFAAGLIVLGGISYSIYTTLMKHLWSAVWELVGATAAALFFVIGLLVVAAASDGNSDAGLIVSAIGLGGWAILLLANAARCALAEQAASDGQRRAGLWFAAAGALVLMAVAYGFPNTSAEDVTAQIVDAAIWFVGTAALLSVLSVARQRR